MNIEQLEEELSYLEETLYDVDLPPSGIPSLPACKEFTDAVKGLDLPFTMFSFVYVFSEGFGGENYLLPAEDAVSYVEEYFNDEMPGPVVNVFYAPTTYEMLRFAKDYFNEIVITISPDNYGRIEDALSFAIAEQIT
jgi:hypothetical protein